MTAAVDVQLFSDSDLGLTATEPAQEPPSAPPPAEDINPRTGKPYKRSPEWRAAQAARVRSANQATTDRLAEEPKPARGAKRNIDATPKEYARAAAGVLQLASFPLMLAARFFPRLRYDAEALALHTPTVATAAGRLAIQDDWTRAFLESSMKVGPRGEFMMALLPLLMQIGVNHHWIPPADEMGTFAPDDLAAELERMTGGGTSAQAAGGR